MNNQTTVKTVSVAGGLATVAFWLLGYFTPDLMATAPIGLEAAITALFAAGLTYLVPGE